MSEPAWEWKFHESIPSELDAGHKLIDSYVKKLEQFGWEGSDLFHVQLAIEEAVVNAITHGNKQAPDKSVEVELRICPASTYLRIRDEGAGFNPDKLADPTDDEHIDVPHGRGVMLIRQVMSHVEYNDCGNQVTMIKHRSSGEESSDEDNDSDE